MKKEKRKINFKDERGVIIDIFTNAPKDHAVVIFSKKGAIRGNHYHKKSCQYIFVVSGQLTVLTQKVGQKRIYRHILKPNDLMKHESLESHTFIADKDTIFFAFADGLRGGKNYEKDTYRLKISLQEQQKK